MPQENRACTLSPGAAWHYCRRQSKRCAAGLADADISMAVMALINLFAVACLSKYALIAWKDYQAQRRAGIREPVFSRTSLPPECAGKLAAGIWDDKAAGATEGK